MRTPSSVMVVACVGLVAACSRSQPADRDHLDLALPDLARPTHVASALELGVEAKATPAAPARSSDLTATRSRPRGTTRSPTLHPRRAREARRGLLGVPVRQPRIAVAPAPAPATQPVAAPAPAPSDPQPTDPQPGHGRGGWSPEPSGGGGIHLPGIGGVIIIRGGHGGMDPCDEHGRGGVFPGPSFPGRGGRSFPGGIVFARVR